MVDQVGGGGALAREAILAAMKAQAGQRSEVKSLAAAIGNPNIAGANASTGAPSGAGFAEKLREGISSIDDQIKTVDDLPRALIEGEVQDIHEVAAQIKKAEFTFKFAMEIRNKLIDSYREVMRMNV